MSTTTTPTNKAAWLVAEKVKPLEVKSAPYTAPGPHELVVRNAAVAINPLDWKLQDAARYPLKYPAILGQDVAGEIIEVGDAVTRFKVGDRVLGHGTGIFTGRNEESGFQLYTVLGDNLTSPIPDSVSFEAAAWLIDRSMRSFPKESSRPQPPVHKSEADGRDCAGLGWRIECRL
ncbi:zinc-binding alcohol dehydrogenase domain-containing protein cipB [Rhinocladiella mackenziei CBS 650.93]|uniref:Zinc-binding alcohol dehydrogenase domain-containing protein cipB n=1 Tax=Rhinocladiella mackenziei CBS 650.93 TaxID=1442369 RepID=A0A0D2JER7_9EURO|nr:zinc-binding alcohol dehydrogenase domain-containing protein cipB [Rhinocladiella mackenziei CBS 650.93]KIX07695.1 zinc-binding alcohol dehydrogenase domain-containing protein cipB [Rhinocladiella mackenziei CBS 650.93]